VGKERGRKRRGGKEGRRERERKRETCSSNLLPVASFHLLKFPESPK
jgi:hypothetical protein